MHVFEREISFFLRLAWIPGGGDLYSSAVAGSCHRGMEAFLALCRRHPWPLSVKALVVGSLVQGVPRDGGVGVGASGF